MTAPVVYGIHSVRVLLGRNPERVKRVLLAGGRDSGRLATIRDLAARAGLPVTVADDAQLAAIAQGGRHQGVVAEVVPRASDPETQLEEALEQARGAPLLLVLDGVQDPHNLGACLRTADACGALAVVIPKDRAVQMNATVRKVAAGAAETTPLAVVTNLARSLRLLKDAGLWIVGADAEAPKLAHETDLAGPVALVMGAEGAGLRQLTRDTCDLLVRLPQQGTVESLNVSVATGMLLYEALRQRLTSPKR
jgi:23S rRNA (guanosine2251-2'-O)-methyltransferase